MQKSKESIIGMGITMVVSSAAVFINPSARIECIGRFTIEGCKPVHSSGNDPKTCSSWNGSAENGGVFCGDARGDGRGGHETERFIDDGIEDGESVEGSEVSKPFRVVGEEAVGDVAAKFGTETVLPGWMGGKQPESPGQSR